MRSCAFAFALLFVAGAVTSEAGGKLKDKTAEQVVQSFHDSKGVVLLSVWVFIVAGITFIPLAWAAMDRVGHRLSELGEHVARTTALLFSVMLMLAGAVGGTLAVTVIFEPENNPPADLVRFVPLLADPIILIAGALCAGVFLAVISRAGQRAGVFPAWFVALGYVTAVAMLAGIYAAPMMLLPVWALASAFVLPRSV